MKRLVITVLAAGTLAGGLFFVPQMAWAAPKAKAPATAPAQENRASLTLETPEELRELKPTLVTLHAENMPAMTALKQLCDQAKLTFEIWPEWSEKKAANKTITANYDQVPFWVAFHDVAQRCGMGKIDVSFENKRQIRLMEQQEGAVALPTSVCGPVIVMLESIRFSRSIDFERTQGKDREARVNFRYLVDPAVESRDFGSTAVLSEMVDDRGASLVQKTENKEHWFSGSSGQMAGSTFGTIEYLGETGKRCVKMCGTIHGSFVLGKDKWVIDDLAKAQGQTHTIGNTTLTINSLSVKPGVCELTINIKTTGKRDTKVSMVEMLQVSAQGASGESWPRSGYSGGGFNNNLTYNMTLKAPEKEKGTNAEKIVLEYPTSIKECDVPFEFRDIPLP